MSSHTPGPWAVNEERRSIESEHEHGSVNDGWVICVAEGSDWKGNACLIAAAPELLAAALATRALVSEAAMTGFNCHDGDWAERLFANQALLSAAISSASEPRP